MYLCVYENDISCIYICAIINIYIFEQVYQYIYAPIHEIWICVLYIYVDIVVIALDHHILKLTGIYLII